MSKRLSDDEKRFFTDQISMLKGENERLVKMNTDLEGEPCSICGTRPALLVDAKEKGTYWMCADCMFESIMEKTKLEADLADIRESHRIVMSEECAPDEKHCTCVPVLRAENEKRMLYGAELAQERNDLKKENKALRHTAEDLITIMKTPAIRGAKTTLQMCKFLDVWISDLEDALLTRESDAGV